MVLSIFCRLFVMYSCCIITFTCIFIHKHHCKIMISCNQSVQHWYSYMLYFLLKKINSHRIVSLYYDHKISSTCFSSSNIHLIIWLSFLMSPSKISGTPFSKYTRHGRSSIPYSSPAPSSDILTRCKSLLSSFSSMSRHREKVIQLEVIWLDFLQILCKLTIAASSKSQFYK